VDINHMRTSRQKLIFAKMQAQGNDYIYVENFNNEISCPESLAIGFSTRHYGIGGDGLVLIEHSDIADAKMRMFNQDAARAKWRATASAAWPNTCTTSSSFPKRR
jgi:carbamoyl-phosphate synthase large subunit